MVGDAISYQRQRLTETQLNNQSSLIFVHLLISRIYYFGRTQTDLRIRGEKKEESKAMQKDKAKEKGPYRNNLTQR